MRTEPEDAEDSHSADHERRAGGEGAVQGEIQEDPSNDNVINSKLTRKEKGRDIHDDKNDERDDGQSEREEISYEEELLESIDPGGECEDDNIGKYECSCSTHKLHISFTDQFADHQRTDREQRRVSCRQLRKSCFEYTRKTNGNK